MHVKNINKENIEDITKFLNSINSIKDIDYNILENGVCLEENNEIFGYITFEQFYEYGLIRYFIFQKSLDFTFINQMFDELIKKAQQIDSFIAIGNTFEVTEIFELLNFYQVDFENFIVNDKMLYKTEFESATILKYDLNIPKSSF